MRFTTDNGSYAITHIEDGELILDNIKSNKKGDGHILMERVKQLAIESELPLSFYAYPQDDTITQDGLRLFYQSCGIDLHPDDNDGKLYLFNA